MDQPFRLDFSQGLFSIQLPGMVLWSIIILIVAFAFRRRSLSDRGKWDKAWEPIPPSLKESPAPMVTAARALSSFVSSVWFWWLWLLAAAVALDLAFLEGEISLYVWQNLWPWLTTALSSLRDWLR